METELKVIFDTVDVNPTDGLLVWDTELLPILQEHDMDQETIDWIHAEVAKADVQGDGLDFDEFVEVQLACTDNQERGEPTQRDMFDEVDANGDGVLDKQEVWATLEGHGVTRAQLDHAWIRVDRDGNDVIDFDEFKQAMRGGLDFYFDLIDMDLDGLITPRDWVDFMFLFGTEPTTIEDGQMVVAQFEDNAGSCSHPDGGIDKAEWFAVLEDKKDCDGGDAEPVKGPDAPECEQVKQGFNRQDVDSNKHVDKPECLAQGECDSDCCDYILGYASDVVQGITLNEVLNAFGMEYCVAGAAHKKRH